MMEASRKSQELGGQRPERASPLTHHTDSGGSQLYDIYHDESKEGGYWHGFLFVPRRNRHTLLSLLRKARDVTGYPHEVHYVRLGKATRANHETAIIAKAWTSIGVASLQQQKVRRFPPKVLLGWSPKVRQPARYDVLDELIKCKFVVFRERGNHKAMFSSMTMLDLIETTFRMGLKGALHALFDEREPVAIGNVYIDGDEHYFGEFGRTFDVGRTLIRLSAETRSYVSFPEPPRVIPQRGDHRKIRAGQNPDDSHLLQLCDILIGGVRFHAYCPDVAHVRYEVSLPCKQLLSYDQQNAARMKESRYCRGFLLSDAWLENDEWRFAPLAPVGSAVGAGVCRSSLLPFGIDGTA